MKVLVASDLDRTLIYSTRALELQEPDASAPRLLCVEVYNGEPLSYMTETAAQLLTELGESEATHFVPTTTRTREQYQRVQLPGPPQEFAICANGGHLLVDGESDPDWQATVTARLADECAPLDEVQAHLSRTADPSWTLKQRTAEDLFAYLVVDRSQLPGTWVEELTDWAAERGWTVSLQGRKIYAVPRPLTKSAAMREIADRTGTTLTLAAGDSLLDTDLLLAADRAWRPGHGELADADWKAPGVTTLEEKGVAAGERITREFLAAAHPETAVPDSGPEPAGDRGVEVAQAGGRSGEVAQRVGRSVDVVQIGGRSVDVVQIGDRSGDPDPDPEPDRSTGRTADPATDRSTARTTDPATDRSTAWTTDPATDRSAEPGADPATDRSADPATDRSASAAAASAAAT